MVILSPVMLTIQINPHSKCRCEGARQSSEEPGEAQGSLGEVQGSPGRFTGALGGSGEPEEVQGSPRGSKNMRFSSQE